MSGRTTSLSLVSLMLLAGLLALLSPYPGAIVEDAEAATVVITESIPIAADTPANDRMADVAADSEGNVHVVWSRNTQHMFYTMLDPRGSILIDATQISNPGQVRAWHPDVEIDSQDNVHVVWADRGSQHKIVYTVLDPSFDDLDGTPADQGRISVVDDFVVSQRAQDRDWPSLAIDSRDNAHIVWEDHYDSLDKFYQHPQIYYEMIEVDISGQRATSAISDTLITPVIGHKGHPDVTVDVDDFVQIAWDDTRGGKVEMAFVIDTSGSMYNEWADVCTVIYGGNFASGGYFQGIKPMLKDANMTVYETVYGLGHIPSAGTSGNCAAAHATGGGNAPRTTPLGQTPGDESGGIRKLSYDVYGGSSETVHVENWGPGTTWACLSWFDGQRWGPQANPPTPEDHEWNPNATKIVIPISDEGPRRGDPSQQSDDLQSIEEAHDACVNAGIVPVGLHGQTYGGANPVASHMYDLAQCPNGVVSVNTRNCPGTTVRNTDAGGQVYEFPSGVSNDMSTLVEALVYISTNNSREIYMSVLDPYGKLEHNSDPGWIKGDQGHKIQGGRYVEDLGAGDAGHLVVVNDTRVTIDDAFSLHPSISVDTKGNTHIAWMDARDHGFEKDDNYEVYYTKLRLRGAAEWNGVPGGLPTFGIKRVEDTAISDVEAGAITAGTWQGNSAYPSLLTDDQNQVHITWLDMANTTAGEEILYVRLNETDRTGPGQLTLDPWEPVEVTHWTSDKLGPNSRRAPDTGQPAGFSNDLGSGAHIVWADSSRCKDNEPSITLTVCYTHVLTGQVDIEFESGETFYHVIEPGQQTVYNLTLNNTTPGPKDLVADTYSVNLTGVPRNWTATLYFSSNHTAIQPETGVFLEGGELVRFYMVVRAPSIYLADHDELASIHIQAQSHKDPAIRSDRLTQTLMDVKHGINLDTSHSLADVEQGQSAIFSITVTNTGNVFDTFAFYGTTTLAGQQEWLLPFGWSVTFPTSVSLEPGASVTKNLKVSVPTSQDPGTFVLYVKGWSLGEPVKSIEKGTYDVLQLWVNVSIRSQGNIVFDILDTSDWIEAGLCATYAIDVIKHFDAGFLVFSTPGAPEARPEEIEPDLWRQEHWTVELDFSRAPGGSQAADSDPRRWDVNTPHTVTAIICAPHNATAGLGAAVTLKAHLQGTSRVSDSVVLSTNIIHRYVLDARTAESTFVVDPGQRVEVPVSTINRGNGPDRYDLRVGGVTDSTGAQVGWSVTVPRQQLNELARGGEQTVDVVVDVPFQAPAGRYTMRLQAFSEEAYDGGRLRDHLDLTFDVREFHDVQFCPHVDTDCDIGMFDPRVENPVKTTAPGRTVRYLVNVTNRGNTPDAPTLHNHTQDLEIWNDQPGMGVLDDWLVSWAVMEEFGMTDQPYEVGCVELVSGEDDVPDDRCIHWTDTDVWQLPELAPYETITMVAIVAISPQAKLTDREIGLKLLSEHGTGQHGDVDETPDWETRDSNELPIEIRLRAPNLRIVSARMSQETSADVGEMIPITIEIENDGNVHATDIVVIICEDEGVDEIHEDGCEEENIAARQVIGALMSTNSAGTSTAAEIVLLYPVSAGFHSVIVVIDPDNEIVEANEFDNHRDFSESSLSSSGGIFDVIVEVAASTWLPTVLLVMFAAMAGVLSTVISGRRKEARELEAATHVGESGS